MQTRSSHAVVFLAGLLWASVASAAPVELPVDLKNGATWEIHTLRVRTTDDDGKKSEIRSESRSTATWRMDGDTAVLTLTPLPGYASADLPPELSGAGLDFALEFEVDNELMPTRLRNWPRLRDAVLKALERNAAGDAALQSMRSLYGRFSNESAAALFAPHLRYLSIGQGLALEVGEALEYDNEVENPFGGPPIASNGTVTLEAYDRKAKRATILWSEVMDPKALAASARETSKALARHRTDPRAAADLAAYDQMTGERKDGCRFEIDATSGLATRSECATNFAVRSPGHHIIRTDTWTITQTTPKGR